jgi:ribosome recycling factor
MNDGNIVRLPFPALTEDRRKDIAKNLKKIAEEAKVGLRNIRRDANEDVKKQEKDKKITEDERKKLEDVIQKHTDSFVKMVDERLAAKEKEVMTI